MGWLRLGAVVLVLGCTAALPGPGTAYPAAQPAPQLDLSKVKGGMLVKDGRPTDCGVGFLDNKAALISAACLELKGRAVDRSFKYEVLVDKGYNGIAERHTVTDFTLHPSFDALTLANNVALIQFNKDSDVTWYNYVWQPNGEQADVNYAYVQRGLTDVESGEWGTAQVSSGQALDGGTCKELSPLFVANRRDLICDDAVFESIASGQTKCKVPAQTVYAVSKGILFQAGFFSHAMVQGGADLCSYKTVGTYYTMMTDYLMFAQAALDRTVYYFDPANASFPQTDADYGMEIVRGVDPSVATMLAGDMYGPINGGAGDSSNGDSSNGDNSNGDNSSSHGSGGGDSSDGLSRKTVIIIAVCASLGSLLLGAAIFALVWWLRRRMFRARDPVLETNAQAILADDIGGATVPGVPHRGRIAALTDDDDDVDENKPPSYYQAAAPAPHPFNPPANAPADAPPAGFQFPMPPDTKYPPGKA
ncbi:hypothetical protein H4R19_000301 [Coemansia spiralis]|nr:hypothetical protein H4R19_000301 [Coemansia spiralis]